MRTVDIDELPLELPATQNFKPNENGESAAGALHRFHQRRDRRRQRKAGDQHDAAVGRQLLVLSALYRSAQR